LPARADNSHNYKLKIFICDEVQSFPKDFSFAGIAEFHSIGDHGYFMSHWDLSGVKYNLSLK